MGNNYFNKKIKICFVANDNSFVRFLLFSQLKFLRDKGYDVYAVCSAGKWVGDIEREGIKVKTINIKRKISPFYDLVTLFRLWNYFRKEGFDIVHTNNPKPGLLGQLAAKMAGVRIVINTIHGLYFQNNSAKVKRNFYIFIEKIAARCSDLIFSVNREDMETLVCEKISRQSKIKYLGNGVDIIKFDAEKFSRSFVDGKKKELKIPAGFKVIGIVARLVEEKGYLDLFEAFKAVLNDFPRTIILAVGAKEPEKKDAVSADVATEYGIEKNIIFLGQRNDVEELYPLMDVFVLPSYREGLPVSVLEAMSEGRPVVATNIRGICEEIDDNQNGILVPVKNPGKLADAIIYFLKNRGRAKEMGENARIKVVKEFNEELVFSRLDNEYKALLKKVSQ